MTKVFVVYHSDTGNTRRMAELVAAGAESVAGVEAELIEAGDLDVIRIVASDGVAIGSPDYFSYVAGQVKTIFDRLLAHKSELSGKPFVGFGSHGGGAKVLGCIESLAASVGLSKVCPGVMSLNAPAGDTVEQCDALGRALAEAASGA